jgi:hypothetical protein
LLGGVGADTGFFFEACNAALEDAQHLLHGIVLTLVFGLHGVEPTVHLRLHGIHRPLIWLNMATIATNKPASST